MRKLFLSLLLLTGASTLALADDSNNAVSYFETSCGTRTYYYVAMYTDAEIAELRAIYDVKDCGLTGNTSGGRLDGDTAPAETAAPTDDYPEEVQ